MCAGHLLRPQSFDFSGYFDLKRSWELNFLQKHQQVSLDMINRAKFAPTFMDHMISDNELSVYEFKM